MTPTVPARGLQGGCSRAAAIPAIATSQDVHPQAGRALRGRLARFDVPKSAGRPVVVQPAKARAVRLRAQPPDAGSAGTADMSIQTASQRCPSRSVVEREYMKP